MLTPWGPSQHQYQITKGIYEVDTAGHGGILVSQSVAEQVLSPLALAKGWHWGGWYAYEEDCDWALFAYEQPLLYAAVRTMQGCTHHTAEEMKQVAREALTLYHPDYLARQEGVATPEQ